MIKAYWFLAILVMCILLVNAIMMLIDNITTKINRRKQKIEIEIALNELAEEMAKEKKPRKQRTKKTDLQK